jgi:polysaccharide export outer membrane protein
MSFAKSAILGALGMCLAGCSLPSAGPTVSQVEKSADPALDVYLVKVTPRIVGVLNSFREDGFPQSFRLEGYRPSIALQPGDVIGINIYEAGGSPLFGGVSAASPGGGGQGQPTVQPATSIQATTLPAQLIESNGQILVPYVGRVKVTGMTPAQASEEISRKLAEQTVRPQVIVSLVGNNANAISVGGEVNKAGLVSLSLRGERLLDVISQAGGPKYTAVETDVRLIRGSSVASIPLQQVLTNPENNIAVKPNDTIQLVRNPKTFVVLGAATKVAQYTLDTERVTVAEGIGRAGGTMDTYGNLAGIFLLRN